MNYNPKVDYLFSKKIIKYEDSYKEKESYYRDVFYKRTDDIRDEKALFLSKMSNVLPYLKDNKILSLDIIKHIYNDLGFSSSIKEEILNKLIEDSIDNYNSYTSINALIDIIKNDVFGDKYTNTIMSSIIHNFVNYHNGLSPVIFDYKSLNLISNKVKNNEIDSAISIITKRYSFTENYNNKNILRTKEEVIEIIKDFFDKYKEEYEIYSIYLYGSYLHNTQTEYSDVDLYMLLDDDKFDSGLKYKFNAIFKEEYDVCADVSVEKLSHKYENTTLEQKEDMVLIIREGA